MSEPTLFPPPPADGGLTERQQLVLEMLADNPAGLRAHDIGIALHQATNTPCSCSPDHACKWGQTDALRVLRSLKARGLARQRKGGLWQHHSASKRPGTRHPSRYDPASAEIPF